MNKKCSAQALIMLLAVVALTVTACKETNSVDSAQSKVEQARQQLAAAEADLAAAKLDAQTQDTADESSATDKPVTKDKAHADDAAQKSAEHKPESEPAQPATAHSQSVAEQAPQNPVSKQVCSDCGTISAIDVVQTRNGPPEYVGTIVGGVVGAALGHQIGDGSGQTIATIVGAVGGALAGHETQQRMTGKRAYRVTIRMDAGGQRVITVPDASSISAGMRVHVRGNNIVLMGD